MDFQFQVSKPWFMHLKKLIEIFLNNSSPIFEPKVNLNTVCYAMIHSAWSLFLITHLMIDLLEIWEWKKRMKDNFTICRIRRIIQQNDHKHY